MSGKTITEWQREVHELAKSKGWHSDELAMLGPDKEIDINAAGTKLLLINCEIAEAFEEMRAGREVFYIGKNGKPEGWGVELADALIRALDFAGAAEIDLEELMRIKHEFNRTREHRHGGKKA